MNWNDDSHALAYQEEVERRQQLDEAQKILDNDPDYIAWLKVLEGHDDAS